MVTINEVKLYIRIKQGDLQLEVVGHGGEGPPDSDGHGEEDDEHHNHWFQFGCSEEDDKELSKKYHISSIVDVTEILNNSNLEDR